MTEKYIHKGIWWLPDNPQRKVSGILSIIPEENLSLEIIGQLEPNSRTHYLASSSIPQISVIWGFSSEAKPISVFGCIGRMTQNSSCPFPIVNYQIQVVIVGSHIESYDEIGDYDIKVNFKELPLWYRPKCLNHYVESNKHFGLDVNMANTQVVTTQISEDCKIQIEEDVHILKDNMGLSLSIKQDSVLRFIYNRPISLRDAEKIVYTFEQFFSLATLSVVQCSHFFLIDKEKQKDPIEMFTKKIKKKINFRFWEYLFVYETIKDSFPKIIKKWYEEEKLFAIKTHLIDSISHKGYFEPNDFLIICQAIEGFYYRFRKDTNLKDAVTNLIDEFSNIDIQEITKEDICYIQDTRHFYSHLLPPGKKNHVISDDHELYNLNHKMRKLLICCVLNILGFSNDEINNICKNSRNSYLRMINEKQRPINECETRELNAKTLSITEITETEPE